MARLGKRKERKARNRGEKTGHHTQGSKGIWEWGEYRVGCGAAVFVGDDAVSEAGGRGKESNAVDGVLGEMERSDPEGELVKSGVASSSESLHLELLSSSSSSSSSCCWWSDGDDEEV